MWGSPRTQRRRRILCAVSNEETRWLLETPLTLSGYLVRTVAKTTEALSMARCRLFDLYVIDLSLCQNEQVDLSQRIRAFDERTPMVLCTADPALRHAATNQGTVLNPRFPERIEKAVATRLERAATRDRESMQAELKAIREELGDRRRAIEEQHAEALRVKTAGYLAYVHDGGTRAGFSRLWPDTLEETMVVYTRPRRR